MNCKNGKPAAGAFLTAARRRETQWMLRDTFLSPMENFEMRTTAIHISNDIPVVTLVRALATAGLTLRNTAGGRLLVEWSPEFVASGDTPFGHVPAFLRASNPHVLLPEAMQAQVSAETTT